MIDYKFIAELEGSRRVGYVPDAENSNSGVTIACGFDIGCRSLIDLKLLFNDDIVAKLAPYCGYTGRDAVEFLSENPLEITKGDEIKINMTVHKFMSRNLAKAWFYADAYDNFHDLSDECQTVVASVAFQYGRLEVATPNFWRQVTTGDWGAALENLRNFGDRYPTRRNKEADLLQGSPEIQLLEGDE